MIRSIAFTKDHQILENLQVEALQNPEILWYWVDFNMPTSEEASELEKFNFHPLAIDDCLYYLQRPKLDYYDSYAFFVLHALNPHTGQAQELDLFMGSNYVVTFHHEELVEVDLVFDRIKTESALHSSGVSYITYKLLDKLVDYYFPIAQQLEDRVADMEVKTGGTQQKVHLLMNEIFSIRRQLLKLRHTIWPMRDLMYRILNSHRLQLSTEEKHLYQDIHDHIEKLASMIDSTREVTADIRDHYLSINSNRMNSVMMTLTVITTIFMPLTFIAGIYGMNFEWMPELTWTYGYFFILGLMGTIAFVMYLWFKRKGWFEQDEP
ncbi:magnesium/cobalt transporter CorA [Hazenella coriacea]|uniref:Magnesium transport protein CorA n=1 Tax=Hazenella coriacea TaxID=1179467 RepID=A0A4R3LDY5_9BACL|nr:magnesium/cobalt transporter CorA [Hazenella coriacea]TCS95666.1 magnesium transporter [Hazenella coriacea]